jgi:hypothetical protein
VSRRNGDTTFVDGDLVFVIGPEQWDPASIN